MSIKVVARQADTLSWVSTSTNNFSLVMYTYTPYSPKECLVFFFLEEEGGHVFGNQKCSLVAVLERNIFFSDFPPPF